jgi:hypothetical protein
MVLNNSSPRSNKNTAHHFNQLSLHKVQNKFIQLKTEEVFNKHHTKRIGQEKLSGN